MKICVIAEYDSKGLRAQTAHVLGAVQKLGASADVFICGPAPEGVLKDCANLQGVSKVIAIDGPSLKSPVVEPQAKALFETLKGYTHILTASTTYGKNLMPRLAALLNVGQISDVIAIESPTVFKRPIYAGNVIATVESLSAIHCLTVRATNFEVVSLIGQPAPIEKLEWTGTTRSSVFGKLQASENTRPDLAAARIVVSGGRALQSAENFTNYIEALADDLGAAVGASRAAVDAGYVPNDYQVGQTGKVVAPELYMAIGISGAIQHLAGMKDSKVIVAINKDPDAPIFQIADYGLVGDLFEIIPELRKGLGLKKAS